MSKSYQVQASLTDLFNKQVGLSLTSTTLTNFYAKKVSRVVNVYFWCNLLANLFLNIHLTCILLVCFLSPHPCNFDKIVFKFTMSSTFRKSNQIVLDQSSLINVQQSRSSTCQAWASWLLKGWVQVKSNPYEVDPTWADPLPPLHRIGPQTSK